MNCVRVVLSIFREQYLQDLVGWLALDESVMPVMGAFLSGLGFEGSDTFLSILQAEPLLAAGSTPIVKVLVALIEDINLYIWHEGKKAWFMWQQYEILTR